LSGLVIGLLFSFSIGFGRPKDKNLPTYIDGCPGLNKTLQLSSSLFNE